MTKEQKIRECKTKQLIDELSKMPPMVIATAYLHAINYTLYGVDVTEKWVTATKNACALEKAHSDGYYEALRRMRESNSDKWIPISEGLPEEGKTVMASTEHVLYPEARYTKESGWEWAYESGADYWTEIEGVKAWMPLPKPYKS